MYDEPTAGLDPVASTVVEDLVRSLTVGGEENTETESSIVTEDGGIAAYIVVTHQHSTIRRSVDRLIFLHEVSFCGKFQMPSCHLYFSGHWLSIGLSFTQQPRIEANAFKT